MTATEILRWFAETSLAVGALILLVLIIRKPFARLFGPRAAYALWLAPMIRLFLPELAILPAPEPTAVWLDAAALPLIDAFDAPAVNIWAFAAGAALFVWIAVAVAWFSVKLETQGRFLRAQLASSAPVSAALTAQAKSAAAAIGLKSLPRIRVAEDGFGPAVIGLFRPVLFLPARFETDYSAGERRLALAHELSHIARGDMIATLAAFAFQAAQWPNPLVHVAMRAFRTDQEAACDAYVLARCRVNGAAGDYASAIVKSAAGAVAPAHGLSLGHPVKERLMLLKTFKQSPLRLLAGGASALTLIAAGLAATASYGYAAQGGKSGEKSADDAGRGRVIVVTGDDPAFASSKSYKGELHFLDKIDDDAPTYGSETKDGAKMQYDDDYSQYTVSACSGDDKTVTLELKSDGVDGSDKTVSYTVVCLSGDDADPEMRVEALRKTIVQMEANAKKEQARREKMIEALREQLREIESKKT